MVLSITSHALESLTPGRIAAAVIVLTVSTFIADFTWKPRYTRSLPRVGCGGGLLGTLQNWFYYVSRYNSWVAEGYENYSKHDRAFVVPSAPSRPQEIVVPRSQTAWMLELPDRVLSAKEAHRDTLYNDYQFFGDDDEFPIQTIHKHLARNLAGLIPGTQEEVHGAIDATLGTDTENWKSVNLWEAWLGIVPRVTNRIIVGAPLCRNQEFLNSQVAFADDVVRNSFFLDMFPRIFQPLVAPFFIFANWWHWRKSYLNAKPVIEQRLNDMARKASGVEPAYEPPEDMITWLIRQAKTEGLDAELNAEMISKRILPVEFAAIHTTVMTGFNLILDLVSSDPSLRYLETIREETARVFAEEFGAWTKNGLARLHRTDSAIKESMRLSHFARALTHRKVVAPEGLTNTVEGWHAPYGAFLMLDLAGTHHDPELYEEPDKYDAWRFSRQREKYEARPSTEKTNAEEAMRIKRLGMVTTSAEYLPFSHGRHACPGRFFVAHELKMILAYLLRNYEIKSLPERPKGMWLGSTIIPPVQVKIEIRRRKGAL
ncbi:cytochrome P450 [Parathielavia appendiculata]|uniref:Cytochrome P450 n=1 Tax=Parathielavia appendiculata TaxID=2587402 RepID=A0AAN6Z6S7_9PEZI|nr:cytochrome P450 [Parathielavia appendiculata]